MTRAPAHQTEDTAIGPATRASVSRRSVLNRPLNIFISHPSDLLTDWKPHGDGLMADRFIRQLAARGHTIHVLVGVTELFDPYPSNVTLHHIQTGGRPESLGSRIVWILKSRLALNRLSRTISFDVIHQLNPVVGGLALGLWGVPIPIVMGPFVPRWPFSARPDGGVIAHFHYWLGQTLRRTLGGLERRLASGVLLSTPAALDIVGRQVAAQTKLHVVPYGVDLARFRFSPITRRLSILFLGWPGYHKGIFVLIRAFAIVSQRIPDCSLTIAGPGSDRDEIAKLICELDLKNCVEFVGNVERGEIAEVIGRSTLVCMPSFGEPFGLVALEAMACGRAVVATDAGGLAYLVSNEGGRKVPVGNPEALAEALIEVVSDPELAQRMGDHNRRLVEESYAWPKIIDRLETAYSLAIHEWRGRTRSKVRPADTTASVTQASVDS